MKLLKWAKIRKQLTIRNLSHGGSLWGISMIIRISKIEIESLKNYKKLDSHFKKKGLKTLKMLRINNQILIH